VSIHGFLLDANSARHIGAQVFARNTETFFTSLQYACAGYFQRLALDAEKRSIGLTKVLGATLANAQL
jgi:hypothetical protein